MLKNDYDAVIFDLGGVILNLDYNRTATAFKELGLQNFDEIFSQSNQSDLFDQFEIGKVSQFHFINRILDQLPQGTTGNQVVHAWNAMILDFPAERLRWLENFGKTTPIYLFSNNNAIHLDAVRRSLAKTVGHTELERYFKASYFSHTYGKRKPYAENFLAVCAEQGLIPERTLFIDDSNHHVLGAREAGLQAILLEKGQEIQSLFS